MKVDLALDASHATDLVLDVVKGLNRGSLMKKSKKLMGVEKNAMTRLRHSWPSTLFPKAPRSLPNSQALDWFCVLIWVCF